MQKELEAEEEPLLKINQKLLYEVKHIAEMRPVFVKSCLEGSLKFLNRSRKCSVFLFKDAALISIAYLYCLES